jgi:hypothetical protein
LHPQDNSCNTAFLTGRPVRIKYVRIASAALTSINLVLGYPFTISIVVIEMFKTPDYQANESYELTDRRKRSQAVKQDVQQIENSRQQRIAKKDVADLARLGKRQVLKVSRPSVNAHQIHC